jgi:hypothetical protein
VEALDRPPRRHAQTSAALPLIAGERHQQDLGALEQVAVIVLAGAPGRVDHRRLRRRQLARHPADGVRSDASHLRRHLGRVARIQVLAQMLEERSHLHRAPVGELHGVAPGEGGLEGAKRQ